MNSWDEIYRGISQNIVDMKEFLVTFFSVKVLTTLLAAVTIILFALAAVNSNETFVGDSAILGAMRVENESWRRFFAQFDTTAPFSISFVLAVSAVFLVFRKRLEALAFLLILPAQLLTITLPKYVVGRPRPEGELGGLSNSFPSGTAATSILVLGFLIYVIGAFVATRWLRILLQILLGIMIVTFGVFRILAGEHWPSDVVGGYLTGGLALFAIIWLYRILRERGRGLTLRRSSMALRQ